MRKNIFSPYFENRVCRPLSISTILRNRGFRWPILDFLVPNDRSRRDELIGGRNVKIGSREPGFPVFGQIFNLDFDPLPVIFRDEHIRPKVLSRRVLSIGVSNSKMLNFSYLEKKLNLVHFSLLLSQWANTGVLRQKIFSLKNGYLLSRHTQ